MFAAVRGFAEYAKSAAPVGGTADGLRRFNQTVVKKLIVVSV